MDGREAISEYKEWYIESYGVKPTEKLIETFCKMKGIDIEQVRKQDREEVAMVEEVKELSSDTDLTAHTANQHTEENFKALETNYHNLLAEFQEVSAIAQEQGNEIYTLAKHLTKATSDVKTLLDMLKPYRDMMSAMDFVKLQEIEKYVEAIVK